ncbi:hypothetical protein ACJX0J_012187, partial [Zea mays]
MYNKLIKMLPLTGATKTEWTSCSFQDEVLSEVFIAFIVEFILGTIYVHYPTKGGTKCSLMGKTLCLGLSDFMIVHILMLVNVNLILLGPIANYHTKNLAQHEAMRSYCA